MADIAGDDPEVISPYEEVANSLMYLFAKRKKNPRLWADCVRGLHKLEAVIDKSILDGWVGQESVEAATVQTDGRKKKRKRAE